MVIPVKLSNFVNTTSCVYVPTSTLYTLVFSHIIQTSWRAQLSSKWTNSTSGLLSKIVKRVVKYYGSMFSYTFYQERNSESAKWAFKYFDNIIHLNVHWYLHLIAHLILNLQVLSIEAFFSLPKLIFFRNNFRAILSNS